MKINIRTKNQVKMSPAVQEYIEEKVNDLEKLFNKSEALSANVLCKGYEKYVVVEITIPLKHLILRAESKGDTLFMAIDLAVDKIERQLLKHKKKVNTMIKKREGISNYFGELADQQEEKEPFFPRIIDKIVLVLLLVMAIISAIMIFKGTIKL